MLWSASLFKHQALMISCKPAAASNAGKFVTESVIYSMLSSSMAFKTDYTKFLL